MSKKKQAPVDPEWITMSELARRAGVSPQAAASWLNYQADKGIELRQQQGRRGKAVDANSPMIAAYINNENNKGDRKPGAAAGGQSQPNPGYALHKMEQQIVKTELAARGQEQKYIRAAVVLATLDKMLELDEQYIRPLPEQIIKRLEKEYGKLEPANRARALALLQKEIDHCIETSTRLNRDFHKTIETRIAEYAESQTAGE
jgi:hypothetical protein